MSQRADDKSSTLPCRTVILRHELPDGTLHFDWMLAQEPSGQQPLLTLRTAERIDRMKPSADVTVEKLPDHRSAYLEYEGEISGNRGSVRRVAAGEIVSWPDREISDGNKWNLHVRWRRSDGEWIHQHLRVFTQNSPHWTVSCVSIEGTLEER